MQSYSVWKKNHKGALLNLSVPERRKLYEEYKINCKLNSEEEKNMKFGQVKTKAEAKPLVIETKPLEIISWDICNGTSHTHYLACTPCPPPAIDWSGYQEGNNPMNYATATVQAGTTETQDQRKYLEKRLHEVYSEKRDPLEATFGLIDAEPPVGPIELAERLKEGKFTIRTGDKDQYRYWHWTDLIVWRDPAAKRDDEGFKAALEALKDARQKALDIIKIDEPKAGLDAVKALEAWEPTGKAN
jgi:hypothetical protein